MGGGLMQLVAYGAQDVYLTGNPQITFFKVVYRRHTNFAIECIECTFQGNVALSTKAIVPITRNGDLVTKMYLKTTLTDADTNGTAVVDVGFAIIDYVELQIGGSRIDRQYGHWLSAWSELTRPSGKDAAYHYMVGNTSAGAGKNHSAGTQLYVPLAFFCNRNDGLALPLIALQYHDVRVEFNFAAGRTLDAADSDSIGLSLSNSVLMVDYIYLDSEERKRFAQASHEYLIEQVQHQQETSTSSAINRFRLNFNHPVKELVWVTRTSGSIHRDYVSSGSANAILRLNGHDRFSQQNGDYFNRVQPYQHHTRSPADGIYCYSFALNPEEHQPSGSCNFSRIDNAELSVTTASATTRVDVYGVNYNVLRIMSGMGGLAYSN